MHNQEFNFAPSKQYLLLLTVVILISSIIIFLLPLLWMQAILFITVIIYGGGAMWRYGLLRSKNSIISVRQTNDEKWLVTTNSNQYQAEILGDSTVTQYVSVLRFKIENHSLLLSCIIFRDSLKSDQYRQMMVAIRG
ncbi:MAG: hypothetical protein ACD_46C00598G0003 [uncultured bacterium]|nr:MAG: hypothetical protein ACD_46C00598G0003 [uncultured bacterium]